MRRWTLGKVLATFGIVALAFGLGVAVVQAGSHDAPDQEARKQLAQVRQATVQYHDFQQACDDGWDERVFPHVPI